MHGILITVEAIDQPIATATQTRDRHPPEPHLCYSFPSVYFKALSTEKNKTEAKKIK